MQTENAKEHTKQIVHQNKRENFVPNSKQLLEQRPRSIGFKSFLNWFKKVEDSKRNVQDEVSSLSSSSEDESSSSRSSTATVASFAFLPANVYKPYGDACAPEKFIASGPYTETYHRLIGERNRRRNLDKNLSLRKKYSLYSSGTIGHVDHILTPQKLPVTHAENVNVIQVYDTFSLPAFAKKCAYDSMFEDKRKTASLSAKDAKSAVNCHVKGKRKAPQPPANNREFTKTYRKKRQAPPPPKQTFYTSHITEQHTSLPEPKASSPAQAKHLVSPTNTDKTKNVFITPSELSPIPWYKRQILESKPKNKTSKSSTSKKKNKVEYPEVGFFRCSRIFESKKQLPSEIPDSENKQEKRVSCFLPNISELDREAAEIIKHHRKDLESQSGDGKENLNSKPSSARDLINKFNALTNATEGNKAKDERKTSEEKSPLGLLARKREEINSSVEKAERNNLFLNNTKSIVINAKQLNKKDCDLCGLENTSSGLKCIQCLHAQIIPAGKFKEENIMKKHVMNNPIQSFQAEVFSAIENFNFSENKIGSSENPAIPKNVEIKRDNVDKNKLSDMEEKHRLREILKEMKNSLPKRPKPVKTAIDSMNKEMGESKNEHANSPHPITSSGAPNEYLDNVKIDPKTIPVLSTLKTDAPVLNSKADKMLETKLDKTNIAQNVFKISNKLSTECQPTKSQEDNATDRARDQINYKVSSSAQTNFSVKKSDPVLISKTAKVDFIPLSVEPKQDESNFVSNPLYINVKESRLAFPKPKLIEQQTNNGNTKLLLKKLETAIAQGNDLLAAKLAKDLALLKVNCSVTSTATINSKEVNMKSIQIFIEDQFSHQGPISIKIKEDITIEDLKTRVYEELHIPICVQRWIIGKQLTMDDNVQLLKLNGNDFNVPLFLYIVAPEAAPEKESKTQVKPDDSKILVTAKSEDPKTVEKLSVGAPTPAKSTNVFINQRKRIENTNIEPASQSPSGVKINTDTPALKDVTKKTWICSACTLINSLLSPLCSACGSRKIVAIDNRDDAKEQKPTSKALESKKHYLQLVNLDNADLVLNIEQFECPVCLMECKPGYGVTLRECLHSFCKECLANTIKFSEEAEIKCPYRDKEYFCDSTIQEREIKSLVDKTIYEQHLSKSVNFAENKIKNAFHCKSPDCKGWCIYEENVNDFRCPVCKKVNCLTCQAIHEGLNCKEHQEREREMGSGEAGSSSSGEAGKRATKLMLEDMISRGEAMLCPSCRVVLMKKWGCDWLRCSMCKTEICWVTRGARWGPAGKNDTSGGCQCGVNGIKCHPKCNYCH